MTNIRIGTPLGARKADLFLQRLAEEGDVEAAARAVGVHPVRAYAHRRQDPAFRETWDDLMVQGLDRVQTALLARAVAGLVPQAEGPSPLSPELTLKLLVYFRQHVGLSLDTAPEPTSDEIDAELHAMLDALEARRTKDEQSHERA